MGLGVRVGCDWWGQDYLGHGNLREGAELRGGDAAAGGNYYVAGGLHPFAFVVEACADADGAEDM